MNRQNHQPSLDNLDARQRIAERRRAREEKKQLTTKQIAGRAIVAAGAAVALFKGGEAMLDAINGPDISEQSTTYVVESGDTLDDIVAENVQGADSIDKRAVTFKIRENPANAEVFENGQLDPGEVLTIPESVSE